MLDRRRKKEPLAEREAPPAIVAIVCRCVPLNRVHMRSNSRQPRLHVSPCAGVGVSCGDGPWAVTWARRSHRPDLCGGGPRA